MINSKGFRDEDGNIITIPGASVKYNPELAGHLAQFGENGEIEDGGEKDQFAPASGSTEYAASNHNHDNDYAAKNHSHTIADVTGLSAALAGKMDALKEVELSFDQEDGYSMHAHPNNLISFLSAGPQLVVVKCSIDTNANNIVNVRAIGSVHIFNAEQDSWEIELRVGETLFGTSFHARDTQEAEETIDVMFDDYIEGARVNKMNVTLFPSVS